MRFDLNPQQIDLAGREVEILRLGARQRHAKLILESSEGEYRVHLLVRDSDGFREIGSTRVPAARRVRLQVEWLSASGPTMADGQAALVKNGRIRATATDLDNYGQVIKRVRLGLPGGSVGVGGGFLVDEYLSWR